MTSARLKQDSGQREKYLKLSSGVGHLLPPGPRQAPCMLGRPENDGRLPTIGACLKLVAFVINYIGDYNLNTISKRFITKYDERRDVGA